MIKYGEIYISYEQNINYVDYLKLLFNLDDIPINDKTNIIISFNNEYKNYDINEIQNIVSTNKKIIFLPIEKNVISGIKRGMPPQVILNEKCIDIVNPHITHDNKYVLNFNKIFYLNKNYNIKNIISSRYNYIYSYENQQSFAIVRKKSNNFNPIYYFAYNSEIFSEIDIIIFIYKILSI